MFFLQLFYIRLVTGVRPHYTSYRLFLSLLLSLLLNFSYSQTYNFRNYSVEKGLPFAQVYAVFQDSKGNLWSGGYGGLSRFDGKEFINYSPKDGLADHWVTSITEDANGNIWIGTVKGLTKFDGKSFTTFTTKHGLASDNIHTVMADRSGRVWISTNEGIMVFDGKSFSVIRQKNGLPSAPVTSLFQDRSGNIWFGSAEGLGKMSFTRKSPPDQAFDNYDIIAGVFDSAVTAIAEDGQGNLWLGTQHGAMRYDGVNFHQIDRKGGLADDHVQALVRDQVSGAIWAGTPSGLSRLEVSSETGKIQSENYKVSSMPNGNNIGKLYQDAEGNLWMGTSNGLYKFRDPSFATFSKEEGMENPWVFPIFRDKKNNLWAGTFDGGFYRYDGKAFQYFSEKEGLIGTWMCSGTVDRDGQVWMGTNKGISIYDGQKFRNIHGRKDGLHGDTASAMMLDRKGRMWVGGNQGGVIWNGSRFRSFNLGTDKGDVWCFLEDSRGYIWIGTYQGGLFRYDPKKDLGDADRAIEDMGKLLGLPGRTFLAMEEDRQGNIYLGSFEGVYIYTPMNGKLRLISEKDGLSSDLVYVMRLDESDKYIYIGTNQGINRLDAEEWRRTGTVWIRQFGTEEGLTSLETNSNGIWRDPGDIFWFGTVNGLVRFDPKQFPENPSETKTRITAISIFYNDTVLPPNADLPYYLNNIAFQYIGICLTNPEKVRYRYMLEGLEKRWSPETRETSARFPNLQPGHYVFKLVACNNEGVWNKVPVSFAFTVHPPFWKTWWFMTSSGILAIVLFVLFLRLRARAIRRKEAERLSREIQLANNELKALRAQMDPHFIFNSLSSIQSFIMSKDEASALQYLSKFARLMRMMLTNSEKSIIPLRAELDALKLYLELEALRFENKFEFEVYADPGIDLDDVRIPTLLIQPYVENAILHGVVPKSNGKGRIEVHISATDTHIICTVTDNGIGRKLSQDRRSETSRSLHESMGMKITGERLEIMNRMNQSELSATITDLYDAHGQATGTRVEIFIPL